VIKCKQRERERERERDVACVCVWLDRVSLTHTTAELLMMCLALFFACVSYRHHYYIPNVSLADQNTSVVDRLGKSELEDDGLKTALKVVLGSERQDVVELGFGLLHDSVSVETAQQSSTLEESLGVLLVEREELTSSLSDLGELEVDPPYFSLVLEAELSTELQFSIQALLLERASWCLVGPAI
jgi:hypothetical protein